MLHFIYVFNLANIKEYLNYNAWALQHKKSLLYAYKYMWLALGKPVTYAQR